MMVGNVFWRRLDERACTASGRGMRVVVLCRLAFLFATVQTSAHFAEQRSDPFAGGRFDRSDRLNLSENFQNLGVDVMHQLFVRGGPNRAANRLRIRRAV